jgi:hypothetical protein
MIPVMGRVMRAITPTGVLKAAFGAEKVYLVTMCDGAINHLHVQLRQPLAAGTDAVA